MPSQYTIENFKKLSPEVVQQLCRLCLEGKQSMWSFYSLLTFDDGSTIDVSKVFLSLTGEDREKMESSKLPLYICEYCLDLLSSANAFQQKYAKSAKILNEYLAQKDARVDTDMHGQQMIKNGKGGRDSIKDTHNSKLHTLEFTSTDEIPLIHNTLAAATEKVDVVGGAKKNDSLATPIEETVFLVKTNEKNSPSSTTQEITTLAISKEPPGNSEMGRTQAKLHRCPICPKLFTALELKKHCSTHQTLKLYLKSAPKYIKKIKFYAKPKAENTGLFNQEQIIHTCPFCQEEFESESFRDHIKEHRSEGNFRCNICNRIFLGINHLKMHQLSHKKEAPFKCKFCKKPFFLKTNYDFHLLKHSDNNELPFKCEYCKKTFSNPEHLKRHRFNHENDVSYHSFYKREMLYVKCKQCQQKFKNEEDKTLHLCKIFCGKCRKLFDTKSKFNSHVCKTKLKISRCFPCGKVFQLPSSYKTHKFRCNRRTLCYVCGKNVTNISQHLLTHYPNKRVNKIFKCAGCNKQFNHKSNLIRHISEVHSNVVRFQCQYCSKGFKGKWNLQVHERIHHGIRTHVCKICNKRFLEKSYLKKHFKVHLRHEGLVETDEKSENITIEF